MHAATTATPPCCSELQNTCPRAVIFGERVVFIFQPAEEHGKGGPAMIKDGLFDRFKVDEVYGHA